ncbi:tetratricopeptide repeat protein [Paraglaciecola sp.]|uniref:tetratricopeptide repeat protein n=1 Tax=Paraglaciecola sp. TaxID=1920173 RepID=UPI0030F41609
MLGDNDKATNYLKQSVTVYPLYGLGHYNLAICYQKTNRPDLSLKHHYLALQTASEDEKEAISSSQNIIDSVKKDLPDGFTIDDYFSDAGRFEQAFELMVEQQHEQAAELFHIIANNQSNHVQARGNLGICYLMLGDHLKARQYLNQALELDAHYQPAHDNLLVLENIESGKLAKPLGMVQRDYYAEKTNLSE